MRKRLVCFLLAAAMLLAVPPAQAAEDDFIRWVDFNLTAEAMERAIALEQRLREKEIPVSWLDILALGSVRSGGKRFSAKDAEKAAAELSIVAVEGGTVEALGWNRYGGWRVGIRSHDRKRYYYYAHLRKDQPYAPGLREGDTVQAGDVIGFMGRTGYSDTENVNNIETVHLHFGLQLIFDESQKDCDNEIWIDVYDIVELLSRHRSSVRYDRERSAWTRVYPYRDLDG